MAEYSMAEAARQVNALVSKSFDNHVDFVSRQLARSILLRTEFEYDVPRIDTPKVITIMLDD